jgi:hypothetical protein
MTKSARQGPFHRFDLPYTIRFYAYPGKAVPHVHMVGTTVGLERVMHFAVVTQRKV